MSHGNRGQVSDGPLKALLDRYLTDQKFHEHANKMMSDPAYRKHVNRMNRDPQYAREHQERMRQQRAQQKAQQKAQQRSQRQQPQPGQQEPDRPDRPDGPDEQDQTGPIPVRQRPTTVPNTSRKPFGNPGEPVAALPTAPFPQPPVPTFSDDEDGTLKMSRRSHP